MIANYIWKHQVFKVMHSIAQTLQCQDLNVEDLNVGTEDLNVRAVLIYIGLYAVITRELPNYVDCTVHQ